MQSVKLGDNIPLIYFSIHGKSLPEHAWANALAIEDKVSAGGAVLVQHGESGGTGKVFLSEQERAASFDGFIDDLARAGYHLVFVGKRNSYNSGTGQTQRVLRYVFRRTPHEEERIRKLAEVDLAELKDWGRTSLWNILAHLNPFYKEGKPVDGMSLVAIDVNGREALFRPDGSRVMRWAKDGAGERIGDAPLPLKPAAYLGIDDGEVCMLVDAPAAG